MINSFTKACNLLDTGVTCQIYFGTGFDSADFNSFPPSAAPIIFLVIFLRHFYTRSTFAILVCLEY